MKQYFGYSLPDFLNLGIAPPPPRGALAVAPRAALVPAFTIHDAYPRMNRAFSSLLLQTYLLPVGNNVNGISLQLSQAMPLIPNPYSD